MNRIAALGATLLLICLPSLATGATFITLSSDPGDPMGASLAGVPPQPFTTGMGPIAVTPNARGGVSVAFVPAGESLNLDFGPVLDQRLGGGRYEIPQRFPDATAGRTALEVYRGGFRCTSITGRFQVLELEYALDGSIVRFAADFEQHCNAIAPALRGGIRFNSAVPYAPPPPPPTSVSGDTAGGPVVLTVTGPVLPCDFLDTQFIDASQALTTRFPYGIVALRAAGCDPDYGAAAFTLDLPAPLPAGAIFWKYGPTPDLPSAHWYTLPYTTSGNTVTFTIFDGGLGDDDLAVNGIISSYGGFSLPAVFQDMWWGGPAENGWGMSIAQHDATLFSVIYAYDTDGSPTWFVMPGGAWDAPFTSYTGPVYKPKGSPFYAYDVSRFVAGAPAGTATVRFSDATHATLEYTIGGVSGVKTITRQLFGPPDTADTPDWGGMWWGGEERKGMGFSVMQQYSTLFVVWFTYDANGAPRWYVLPGGSWVDLDPSAHRTYAGRVYKTTGSPWVGRSYDPAQLRVFDVGTLQMHFDGDTALFDYVIEGHSDRLSLERQPF